MMYLYMLMAFLLSSNLAWAGACPKPKELDDVLVCLKENHYLVQQKKSELNVSSHLAKSLSPRINPVLEIESLRKSGASQTQVSLTQELDLGGRINVLKKQGMLIHSINEVSKSIVQDDVIEAVLLNIHHLLHLHETIKLNEEFLKSLESVISGLSKRVVLSPEQEVSLINFKIQRAEVINVLSLLEDQQSELLLFFYLNGGYEKDDMLAVMDDHHHPMELKRDSNGLSLNLKKLGLQTKLSEQEFKLQKASLWSGISIGPTYSYENMGDSKGALFGISLSMPLPIWNTFKSQKEHAQAALMNSQKEFDLTKRKEEVERKFLDKRIRKLKESLGKMPKKNELIRSHRRMEELFSQGVITSSIFLDSHRIWRDVISSELELEEQVLRLTISYYRLNSELSEVHL